MRRMLMDRQSLVLQSQVVRACKNELINSATVSSSL